MTEKQTDRIGLRVGPDLKVRADAIAERYKTTTSSLAKALLETFCEAVEQHGDRTIWPPQFNYHISKQTYLTKLHQTDEQQHLAADPPPGQRHIDLEEDLEKKLADKSDAEPQENRPTG